MRLVVFFDLPVETAMQRKHYRLFRRFLIGDGYMMMQESVYTKMAIDPNAANSAIAKLRKNKAPAGLIQVLKVTEKQFAGIEDIVGKRQETNIAESTDRLIIL